MERGREGRGRRGGEMRKGRRGLVIGGMVRGLLMGCNNGLSEELAAEKRLGEIGRSAEKAFYSFIDFIADTLGFRVTAETTKQVVGQHFATLGTKLEASSKELDKVAEKEATDGDKEGPLSKAIKEAVEAAKATLKTLKTHLDDLGTVGGTNVVGWAASGGAAQGTTVSDGELKIAYKALKGIVDEAGKVSVKKPIAGSAALNVTGVDNKNGAKILSTNGAATSTDAAQAAAILASVSGDEMLASIVESKDVDAALGSTSPTVLTTAMNFARGGNAANLPVAEAKAAAVAGGIALRSLVKEGKLASGAADAATGGSKDVQAVGIDAVNKLLRAVEDIIKKAVKNVLKEAKEKIDKARDSKATVQ